MILEYEMKHDFKVIDLSKLCVSNDLINLSCKDIDKVDHIKYLDLQIMGNHSKWRAHINYETSIVKN